MTPDERPVKGHGTRSESPIGESPLPEPGAVVGRPDPPFEVVGLDALSPVLSELEFPATKEALVQRIGDVRVPVTKSRAKPVREILERVTPTEFQSASEVEEAVKARWSEIAETSGRGGRHAQRENLRERPRGGE